MSSNKISIREQSDSSHANKLVNKLVHGYINISTKVLHIGFDRLESRYHWTSHKIPPTRHAILVCRVGGLPTYTNTKYLQHDIPWLVIESHACLCLVQAIRCGSVRLTYVKYRIFDEMEAIGVDGSVLSVEDTLNVS